MYSPIDSPLWAFIDLETVGTDRELHPPIEIGIAIVEREGFTPIDVRNFVVKLEPDTHFPPRVLKMHTVNGLIAAASDSQLSIEEADDKAAGFVGGYGQGRHIPLAGSGVAHFDRPFIKRWMPKLDATLSHWAMDVGVLRRSFGLIGISPLPDEKTHRALDDALFHAKEFRYYLDLMKGVKK